MKRKAVSARNVGGQKWLEAMRCLPGHVRSTRPAGREADGQATPELAY